MKYHTARVKHDPPHSYGDCFRASLACLLDCERPEDVPHFFDNDHPNDVVWKSVNSWLAERQLATMFVNFPAECSFDDICKTMKHNNLGMIYMLFGNTTSNTDHVVICRDDKQIHNVSWFGGNLTGPSSNGFWTVFVLVPSFLYDAG